VLKLKRAGKFVLNNYDRDQVYVNGKLTTIDVKNDAHALFPVISNYRSPSHNKKIGGIGDSFHMHGRALDLDYDGDGEGWSHDWEQLKGVLGFNKGKTRDCRMLAEYLEQKAGALDDTYCRLDSVHAEWSR
jgi:hypothetical protein